MSELILKMAAQMLSDYVDELSNHGCNDYDIESTPENVELVKDMISKSDYPKDEPDVWNDKIHFMDWEFAAYLRDELLRLSTPTKAGEG
jgi:hypothetical protein